MDELSRLMPDKGEADDAPADDIVVAALSETGSTGDLSLDEPMLPLAIPVDPEALAEEVAHHTGDEEIIEDFADRQALAYSGHEKLLDELYDVHVERLELAGGDLDADWDGIETGEEFVGGSTPTPDQDIVDLLGAAVGIVYEDDEPLRTGELLEERDRHRAELDPDLVEDELDGLDE